MAKRLIQIGLLAFLCASAFADVARWELGAAGSAGAVTVAGSGSSYILTMPNVTLAFCNYPANAVPCTNYAVTYTTIAGTIACSPSNAQIVLQGSSTCQATSDVYGAMGVYVAPGNYSYTLTAFGVTSGPYTVTVGGGTGGGGGGSGCSVNPADGGCALAGSPSIDQFIGAVGSGTGWLLQLLSTGLNSTVPVNILGTNAGTVSLGYNPDPGIGSGISITAPSAGTPYGIYLPNGPNSGYLLCSNVASKLTCTWESSINLVNDVGTSVLDIPNGGTNATTASGAMVNLLPPHIRVGDVIYWSGSAWNVFGGNTGGGGSTGFYSENGTGSPGWVQIPIPIVDGGYGLTTLSANAIYRGNGTSAPLTSSLSDDGTHTTFISGVVGDGGGFKHKRQTGCTTGATAGNTCTNTVTWGTAFADANYTPVCMLLGTATLGHIAATSTSVIAAASVKFETVTDTNAAITGTVECHAVHD